jgi:membrane-bound lytic murein transglycosylase A
LDAGGHQRRVALTRKIFVLGLVLLLLAAGGVWWFTRPKPYLRETVFSALPGWSSADLAPALSAFRRSCAVIGTRPAQDSMGRYAGSAADWQKTCAHLGGDARQFFEKNFVPYEFGADGLFTGYYEPEIRGSRERHDGYQTPVYGLPADLIRVELSQFGPQFKGEHIAGKLEGRRLVPYWTRAQIDAKGLPAARVLFWCDDPVALFFLQIQGSGRVQFDEGGQARLQYAGENGRPYTAIGRVLVAAGRLARDRLSMQSIRDWLKANPALARGVMEADQSFIFFQEAPIGDPGLGSPGVEGVPLTPDGSMAIDLRQNVLGAPYYVAADSIHRLLIAQDTGGAIRGPTRGDIFFGFGAAAEKDAGGLKAQGRLYVLLPNDVAQRLGPSFTP